MPLNRNEETVKAATSAPTAIAASQSVSAAGPMTLNGSAVSGGVASLGSVQQPVVITSGGDDSGITFTITGTDYANAPISEVLDGADSGAATSALLYKTVTSIVASAAAADTVEAGTGVTQYGPWLILGSQRNHYQFRLRAFPVDSGTFSIQATSDPKIMLNSGGYADDIETVQDSGSAAVDLAETAPWMAVRLVVTAGTATLRVLESRTA